MEEKTIYKALAIALVQNRDGVIKLLNKNGVLISSSASDRDIILAVLDATRKNARFRSDLATLLAKSVNKNQLSFTGEGMFGFTGENMFRLNGVHPPNGWYGADGVKTRQPAGAAWKNSFDGSADEYAEMTAGSGNIVPNPSPTPSPTPTPKTGSALSGIFSSTNISNILNSGLGVLSTTLSNKSNKQLADTALQIEQEKTKQAALLAQGGAAGTGAKTTGMSTGAKIGLVVLGLGAIGVLVYFIARKKGKG